MIQNFLIVVSYSKSCYISNDISYISDGVSYISNGISYISDSISYISGVEVVSVLGFVCRRCVEILVELGKVAK